LNAFCGLNLASHALGLNDRDFSYLYADPAADGVADDIDALLAGRRLAGRLDATPVATVDVASDASANPLMQPPAAPAPAR